VACDLIPYPLLLEEKGDDCDAAPVGPSLSFSSVSSAGRAHGVEEQVALFLRRFRRGTEDELARLIASQRQLAGLHGRQR
jgi:hypothetical protein